MHDLIVPERHRANAFDGLTGFFHTGTGPVVGKSISIEALRMNGKEFPVELTISAVNMEGEWRAIGIVRDTTERKLSEDEIRRVNKELNDFAYVVSHDLKAPLCAIGTIASWIAEDYKDKLDDAGREQLSTLIQRTLRMHDMIEGILQYSRVGRVKGKPDRIDTGKVAEQVRESLSPPDGIRINIHEPMPAITIDPTQITQVIQNLVGNAIKHIGKPEGIIDVGCKESGYLWEFYVKDNGPGIDEKHFERIFQIFQTLKPRDEFESTGIGLAIVKKIIEQNGGKIWVESEVGKGSIFRFTIPKST